MTKRLFEGSKRPQESTDLELNHWISKDITHDLDAKECRISKVMTHDLDARNAKAMVLLNQ
jgi:hypothetical protein